MSGHGRASALETCYMKTYNVTLRCLRKIGVDELERMSDDARAMLFSVVRREAEYRRAGTHFHRAPGVSMRELVPGPAERREAIAYQLADDETRRAIDAGGSKNVLSGAEAARVRRLMELSRKVRTA